MDGDIKEIDIENKTDEKAKMKMLKNIEFGIIKREEEFMVVEDDDDEEDDKKEESSSDSETELEDIDESKLNIKSKKENAELKFCLNNVNKKFENEIKGIKRNNELKEKELKETKEVIKKNATLIELLGEKISKYEKIKKEYQNLLKN